MRSLLFAAIAALAFASAAQATPHCTKGVPCGNTCVAKGKLCHVPTPTPPKPVICRDKHGKFIHCPPAH